LITNILDSGEEVVTVQTDDGSTITAAAINTGNLEVVTSSDGVERVAIPIEGSNVVIAVPSAAIPDGAVAVVTVFDPEVAASFNPAVEAGQEDDPPRLAAQPISIRLVDESGNEISIFDLAEPITVELDVPNMTEGEEIRCAWWDEDLSEWITDGVTRDESIPDRMVCVTTHLTVFGAIAGGLASALQCGNVEILTEKGLNRLWKGDWYTQLGAIMWWLLLIFQGSVMSYFTYRGWVNSKENDWREEDLLTDNAIYNRKKTLKKQRIMDESQAAKAQDDDDDEKKGFLDKVKDKAKILTPTGFATVVAKVVAENSLAVQQRVNAADLKVILAGAQKMKGGMKRRKQAGWGGDAGALVSKPSVGAHVTRDVGQIPIIRKVGNNATIAFSSFFEAGFCSRVWILFNALNAWISLRHFSFTLPQTTRTLLLICRVQGSLFVSAFFFQGTASGKGSDPQCNPQDFWGKLGFNLMISFFAFIFGSVPYLIMVKLSVKGFVYREEWDEVQRIRYLMRWRCQAWALWIVAAGYVCFCTLFVTAFLANVAEGSEIDWVTTASLDLILELFVRPFLVAVMLAAIISYAQGHNPQLVEDEVNKVQKNFKALLDEEERRPGQDMAVEDAPAAHPALQRERSEELEDVAPHRGMFQAYGLGGQVDPHGYPLAEDEDYDPNVAFGLNMPPPPSMMREPESEASDDKEGSDNLANDDFGFLRSDLGASAGGLDLPALPPVSQGREDLPLPEGFRMAPLPRISPLYAPRPISRESGPKPPPPNGIPVDLPIAPSAISSSSKPGTPLRMTPPGTAGPPPGTASGNSDSSILAVPRPASSASTQRIGSRQGLPPRQRPPAPAADGSQSDSSVLE